MIILQELEIKNCFSQKHVLLHFEKNNYVTIFNCSGSPKNNLIHAVEPFFCKDKALFETGAIPGSQPGSSQIRMKFIISITENARNTIVDAMRLFSNPDVVLYYFGEQQYIDTIQVFHERCQIDVFFYTALSEISLLNFINDCSSDKLQISKSNENFNELLVDYLSVSNNHSISNHTRIAKYMKMSLLIDKELELLKKRTFVDIVNEIGYIFRYITWEEYSVKFVIPLFDKKKSLQYMNWDNLNLSETETWINKGGSNISCIWNELEPGLREIMKISQSIALAKHLKKKCILIENTAVLEKYQNREMMKEVIVRTINTDSEKNLTKKNYLWRIVDICCKLKLTVFIGYNGKLPLLPSNANIIQCNNRNPNTGEWMCVHVE